MSAAAESNEPVHEGFELTYANYLVLHRTLMQSMPVEWQRRIMTCVEELNEAFGHVPQPYGYLVQARDADGRFVKDPVPHYNRGRTRIEPAGPR